MMAEKEKIAEMIDTFVGVMVAEKLRDLSTFCKELGAFLAALTELKITAPEASEICKRAMYSRLKGYLA
jgi:hypothetical protein